MIQSLIIGGFLVFIGVMLFIRGMRPLDWRTVLRYLMWIIVGIGGLLGVFFLLFRRFDLLITLLPLFAPLMVRMVRRVSKRGKTHHQSQRSSNVNTRFLKMYLDHETGTMEGFVYAGRHAESWLSQLPIDDVMELLEDYRTTDPQSAMLIESWLDRMHGQEWRQQRKESGTTAFTESVTMTREQAYDVLGLSPGASVEQIKEAYRRLIVRVHPDHGGTSFFTIQLNRARDTLLQE